MHGSRNEIEITIDGPPRLPNAGIIVRSAIDRPIVEALIDGESVEAMDQQRAVRLERSGGRIIMRY